MLTVVVKRYGPDLLRDQNRLPLRILLENARYSRFDLLKDPDRIALLLQQSSTHLHEVQVVGETERRFRVVLPL